MPLYLLISFMLALLLPFNSPTSDELTAEETALLEIINEYRITKNLAPVAHSPKLTKVAKAHAKDLQENFTRGKRCNMHSWSKKGPWSDCCYTDDHKRANCMWDKPKEIAGYDSPGYEIAYWHSAKATPEHALEVWIKSPGHHSVLANLGPFKDADWKAIGVGIYKEYAIVWFGEMEDGV